MRRAFYRLLRNQAGGFYIARIPFFVFVVIFIVLLVLGFFAARRI